MTLRTEKVVASATLLVFSLGLTSNFWPNLFLLPGAGVFDWFQQLAFDYSMVDAVRNHGEYPLWNPYFGGGIPWAGYIANSGLTPISLVIICCGEVVAIKLLILLAMVLAGYGMYATCREWLGLDMAPALLAGLIFVGSSKLAGELGDGNYKNLALFTLPFFALCLLRLLQRRWLGLLLPIVYMTAFAEGKYAPLVIAGTLLLFALAYRAAAGQTAVSVLVAWGVSLGAGVAFAAPKLLPLLELMQMDRVDQTAYHDGGFYSLGSLVSNLVGFPDNIRYLWLGVGFAGVALALVGVLADRRRSLGLAGTLVVVAAFAMGPASPLPLWRVTRMLPIVESLNSEGKYFSVSVLFCVCGLLAIGCQRVLAIAVPWIATKIPGPAPATRFACAAFLYVAVLWFPVWLNRPVFNRLFSIENGPPLRQNFHHVASRELLGIVDRYRTTEPPILLYNSIRSGVGTLTWYGNMVFPETPKAKILFPIDNGPESQAGYRGELYCAAPASRGCRVSGLRLTYNTIQFHIESVEPTTAVINFNYHPGWSSRTGHVLNHDGLLAVQVPTGYVGQVDLRFSDARFWSGCGVLAASSFAWFGGGVELIRRRRRALEAITRNGRPR